MSRSYDTFYVIWHFAFILLWCTALYNYLCYCCFMQYIWNCGSLGEKPYFLSCYRNISFLCAFVWYSNLSTFTYAFHSVITSFIFITKYKDRDASFIFDLLLLPRLWLYWILFTVVKNNTEEFLFNGNAMRIILIKC